MQFWGCCFWRIAPGGGLAALCFTESPNHPQAPPWGGLATLCFAKSPNHPQGTPSAKSDSKFWKNEVPNSGLQVPKTWHAGYFPPSTAHPPALRRQPLLPHAAEHVPHNQIQPPLYTTANTAAASPWARKQSSFTLEGTAPRSSAHLVWSTESHPGPPAPHAQEGRRHGAWHLVPGAWNLVSLLFSFMDSVTFFELRPGTT